jgi:hypothetical protein
MSKNNFLNHLKLFPNFLAFNALMKKKEVKSREARERSSDSQTRRKFSLKYSLENSRELETPATFIDLCWELKGLVVTHS